MTSLKTLLRYFPAGRAETEVDFLRDVFVMPDQYYSIISPDARSIRLIVGNKGTGKSALLQYIVQQSGVQKIPAIFIKPDDILSSPISDNTSVAAMKKAWHDLLVLCVASKVGETISGLVPEVEAKLLEEALRSGAISPGLMKTALNILTPIGKALSEIDFAEMLPKYTANVAELKRGLTSALGKKQSYFFLCIDDMDQMALPSDPLYLERIWSFILGAQKLAETLPSIKILISVRSEIWRRLAQDNHGARDQIDHFRPLVKNLTPSEEDMYLIVRRRIEVAAREIDPTLKNGTMPTFFEGDDCKLPSVSSRRLWEDYFITSSRNRPRDTMQLIRSLAENAIENQRSKISDADVDQTALRYSDDRVRDVVNENEVICPQLEVILRSFAKVPFEMGTDPLKAHISGLPGSCRIEFRGVVVHHGDEDQLFAIWKLLFDAEFLTPRIPDASKPRGFRHVRPSEDPTLVSRARWNDMLRHVWDVHPCYRSYLLNEREKIQSAKRATTSHLVDTHEYKAGKIKKR